MNDAELLSRLEALKNQADACQNGYATDIKNDQQFRRQLEVQYESIKECIIKFRQIADTRPNDALSMTIQDLLKEIEAMQILILLQR